MEQFNSLAFDIKLDCKESKLLYETVRWTSSEHLFADSSGISELIRVVTPLWFLDNTCITPSADFHRVYQVCETDFNHHFPEKKYNNLASI